MSDRVLGNSHIAVVPTIATVLASYNCTAACEHCCFDSHPGIKKRLSLSEIKRFIDSCSQIPKLRLVAFSGGECFLLGRDLDAAVSFAADRGLATRCVTNGYWAKTPEKAVARLSKLRTAGLKELNVSTGDFHLKYVPIEHVIYAAEAALSLNISMVIVVEMQRDRVMTARKLRENSTIKELVSGTRFKKRLKILESPWMPTSAEEIIDQAPNKLLSRFNVAEKSGCDSIFTTLVATPDPRNIGICCGLSRERIPELNVEWSGETSISEVYQSAASDFVKIWLYVEGPEKILAWAASKDPTIDWENHFAHKCHACLGLFKNSKVRAAIQSFYRERLDEILIRYAIKLREHEHSFRDRKRVT